jgi:hypothetical protein
VFGILKYPATLGRTRRGFLLVLVVEFVVSSAAFGVGHWLPILHERLWSRPGSLSPYAIMAGNYRFATRVAWTDRGRPIRLRGCSDLPAPDSTAIEAEDAWLREQALDGVAIRTGNPGPYSNCYGWTFTGGRFALDEDINIILEDNGYDEVDAPQPGDLVIYRGGGTIVHVGIVRRCAEEGEAIIESKWGARARYHHPVYAYPVPQGYRCVYYRSARRGHQLQGVYE